MPETTHDDEKFAEQLPLYVNGTLGPEERSWMDSYLQVSTQAQGELKLTELISATINSYKSPVPEAARRSRLLAAWRASRAKPTMLQTVLDWIKFPVHVPAAAMAVVSMLVIGQFAVILSQPSEGENGAWRGEKQDCAIGSQLRVIFDPDAKQGDIVQLLRSAHVVMRDGPSDSGEVWLTVTKGHTESEAIALLRTSALVDDVLPSAAIPPKTDCKP